MDKQLKFLKALADETRLKIVLALIRREMSASEIVQSAGRSQPAVSLGLRFLHEAGIITSRKEGRYIFYNVADPKVKKLISMLDIGDRDG